MMISSTSSALPVAPRASCPVPAASSAETGDSFQALRGTWWQPPMRPAASPCRPAATQPAPPKVGDQRQFYVWDMSVMPPSTKQVTSTCRAVGDTFYLFVDDSVWGKQVTQEDVDSVFERFAHHAPSGSVDPSRGVAANDHDYFGAPRAGLDGDRNVNVLLTEIASFHGTTLDGYFNPFDTISDSEAQAQGQRSNEKNILYLNTGSQRISGDYMQAVMAHEYQHLLHHPWDPEEESWLSETFGEMAMQINGYHTDQGAVVRHQAHPERPLVTQGYVDYGACMTFGSYLLERYGKSFAQELSRDPRHGIDSINGTLEKFGRPERFDGLYRDWMVANYADSKGVAEPGLHYGSWDLPRPAELELVAGQTLKTDLAPTGARYVRLPGDQPLLLHAQEDGPGATLDLLSFDGHRMVRTALDAGKRDFQIPAGSDRVLVVGSLAQDKLNFELSASPSA